MDDVKYIDTGSVSCGRINAVQLLRVGVDKVPSRARRKVRDGSIIFSAVRPNQKHYAILNQPEDNVLVSTGFIVIDCIEELVNPKYCYYALILPSVTEYFQSIAEQSVSTYPTLGALDVSEYEIDIPDRAIQNRIVNILESLDRKIEVNSKTNDYLAA